MENLIMEKFIFDGYGITDADNQDAPPLAIFSDMLLHDWQRAKAIGAMFEAAPAMLAALELVAPLYDNIDSVPASARHLPFYQTGKAIRAAIAQAKGLNQ